MIWTPQLFCKREGAAFVRAVCATLFIVLVISASGIHSLPANALSGDLDSTFGVGGVKYVTCLASTTESSVGRGVVIQPDGNIVVAGFHTNATPGENGTCVLRLTVGGSVDTTYNNGFGVSGLAPGYSDYAVALQSDGKIVTVGSKKVTAAKYNFHITRWTSAGNIDTTFASFGHAQIDDGSGINEAIGVAVQPDGLIVVGGSCSVATGRKFCAYRVTATGGLDTSFGAYGQVTGIATGTATGMLLQPDGKIVLAGVCGGAVCVERYTANGGYDTTFGGSGSVIGRAITDVGSVALQGDGGIVVASSCVLPGPFSDNGFCPTRIASSGAIDSMMGRTITAFSGYSSVARGIQVQDDGKVVIAGRCFDVSSLINKFCVARYNSDGSADRTFNTDGRNIINTGAGSSDAYALAIQNGDGFYNRGIIIVGACEAGTTQLRFCAVRLESGEAFNRRCSLRLYPSENTQFTLQDTLIATRVALGFTGTAVFVGTTGAAFGESAWYSKRRYLVRQCGLELAL